MYNNLNMGFSWLPINHESLEENLSALEFQVSQQGPFWFLSLLDSR